MRRLKWIALPAVLAMLAAAGVAAADHLSGPPKTEAVGADFTGTRTFTRERLCDNAGDKYRYGHDVYRGKLNSTDSRLAGDAVLRLKSFVNQATGDGWTHGKVTLFNPDTHALKMVAHVYWVNTKDGAVNGMLMGRLPEYGGLGANLAGALSGDTLSFAFGAETPYALLNSAVAWQGECPKGEDEGYRGRGEGRFGSEGFPPGKAKGHDK